MGVPGDSPHHSGMDRRRFLLTSLVGAADVRIEVKFGPPSPFGNGTGGRTGVNRWAGAGQESTSGRSGDSSPSQRYASSTVEKILTSAPL